MKIRISQQILLKGIAHSMRNVYKTHVSNIIPHKGDFIFDTAFKDPYEHEVIEVIIDYSEDMCHVQLSAIEINSTDEKHVKRYAEMMMSHGWECPVL